MDGTSVASSPRGRRVGEVFAVFLGLGLTSFGGPVAHLGYFRRALVERRGWLSDDAYADLVALCQFLPGPASSQVGMAIGLRRAGLPGLLAAWVGFTMPSALLMVGFAYGVGLLDPTGAGWIAGFEAAAVAVVATAVLGMAATLTPDRERATIALAAMVAVVLSPAAWTQIAAIPAAGLAGLVWLRPATTLPAPEAEDAAPLSRVAGVACLAVFAGLLVGLPLLAAVTGSPAARLAADFYRAGSLVFGGGHVVLPLLQAETVQPGLLGPEIFLAGYGAVQAVPGPLFTFAAYLGFSLNVPPNGLAGAAIALVAVFLPSALIIAGALPFWDVLRRSPRVGRALTGVNAAVVGILAAALYAPVFTTGVHSPVGMAVAATAFLALTRWKLPAWAVVCVAGLAGEFLM